MKELVYSGIVYRPLSPKAIYDQPLSNHKLNKFYRPKKKNYQCMQKTKNIKQYGDNINAQFKYRK